MPRLSQWMVRSAMIYLLLGLSIGALLLAHKGIPIHPALWRWLPAHSEFLLMGWIVQITMGVAFWILPRYRDKARRPSERCPQLAFVLLNLGIWLVVAGTVGDASEWVLMGGRAVELLAIACFAVPAWQRTVGRDGARA